MIPTLILIGFLVGFIPRPWYLLGIVIAAALWPLVLVLSGATAIHGPSMLGEFALAAVNAAVGAVVARLFLNLARAVRPERKGQR